MTSRQAGAHTPRGVEAITWLDESTSAAGVHHGEAIRFRIGDVEFDGSHGYGSSPDRFLIRKHRPLVEAYLEVLNRRAGGNVVEVGLADGGSMALAALATDPARHVGLELDPNRLVALDALLDRLGAADRFRPHFGVDQGDRDLVTQIVEDEFGGAALDVVIDDASHLLGPTRVTFDTLFARLRPGGVFLIEDWNWDHLLARSFAQAVAGGSAADRAIVDQLPATASERAAAASATTPLSILVIELVLAQAESGDVVAGLEIGPWTVTVTRGDADLDPRTFRLADHYADHLHLHPREPGIGSFTAGSGARPGRA